MSHAPCRVGVDSGHQSPSAAAHLLRHPATRIALTGSNGKTTTKELIAAALAGTYGAEGVWATVGNLNNHIGSTDELYPYSLWLFSLYSEPLSAETGCRAFKL